MVTPMSLAEIKETNSNQPLEQRRRASEIKADYQTIRSKTIDLPTGLASNEEKIRRRPIRSRSGNNNFETLFCEACQISSEKYCETLLFTTVHWYSRPIVRLILTLYPSIFSEEFRHLERLKTTNNRHQFISEMMYLEDHNKQQLPHWRKALGLRISIGELSKMSILLRSKSK